MKQNSWKPTCCWLFLPHLQNIFANSSGCWHMGTSWRVVPIPPRSSRSWGSVFSIRKYTRVHSPVEIHETTFGISHENTERYERPVPRIPSQKKKKNIRPSTLPHVHSMPRIHSSPSDSPRRSKSPDSAITSPFSTLGRRLALWERLLESPKRRSETHPGSRATHYPNLGDYH